MFKMEVNMLRKLITLFCLCFLAILLSSCSNVQTGKIRVCKKCGEEISNTVHTITVPFWETDKYRVQDDRSGYCLECGNQEVEYKIIHGCGVCGKILRGGNSYCFA